jgi:hypothetical protein
MASEADEADLKCYNPFLAGVSRYGSHYGQEQEGSLEDIIQSIMRNSMRSSLPDSISILINFGTENNHVLYSTDRKDHNCR